MSDKCYCQKQEEDLILDQREIYQDVHQEIPITRVLALALEDSAGTERSPSIDRDQLIVLLDLQDLV